MRRPSAGAASPIAASRSGRRARRRSGSWRGIVASAVLAALAGGTAPSNAQNASRVASEEGVKAAYLFKFPAYVDWPPGVFERPDSAVTIAVMEDERLAAELAAITAGRTVGGRPIEVRRVAADDPLAGVHVLFQASRDRDGAAADLPPAGPPILTVANAGGPSSGIVLTFLSIDGRVRFEVDLDEAERRGLRLHSGLLAVAERVHRARQ